MEHNNLKILKEFTIHTLPNLDIVVLGALELLIEEELPKLQIHKMGLQPLVVGSANAHAVGRILFKDTFARFSEEGDFESNLKNFADTHSIVIVSASGGKHAVKIAERATVLREDLPVWLLTNNKNAPAGKFVHAKKIITFPKNREPYTYNTSTYLSMILSHTKESSEEIYSRIDTIRRDIPENLGRYSSFVITVPSEFEEVRSMFRTKFDELFGGHVVGRIFTDEEIKHAKTVVPYDKELTVHFVIDGTEYEEEQENDAHLYVPLSKKASYGEMLALGYFVIGKIQEAHPAYFKENIVAYTKDASEIFNQTINPIVE